MSYTLTLHDPQTGMPTLSFSCTTEAGVSSLFRAFSAEQAMIADLDAMLAAPAAKKQTCRITKGETR